MQYKRYVKLRKYVNGVATDEIKKGILVGIVEAESQSECENGQAS